MPSHPEPASQPYTTFRYTHGCRHDVAGSNPRPALSNAMRSLELAGLKRARARKRVSFSPYVKSLKIKKMILNFRATTRTLCKWMPPVPAAVRRIELPQIDISTTISESTLNSSELHMCARWAVSKENKAGRRPNNDVKYGRKTNVVLGNQLQNQINQPHTISSHRTQ
ncbi:hypothetical protein PAAG_00646 [Paracoccidioides lutzii Pb01]|uniref:Uncharacterized protein n=1 Tax=Paracoccidioides lutzii (strain ATCC MYA-826 / Pb01) TaxID=502779 RepID=C1GQ51_PARBA|nr:hypothetical protein PAAG_00646 [Paracoccidioides lutzii Pb01]EEH37725.2 hypothetical protein PAAG_00646 [Paracoccidioides lutzii Pb01]